MSENPNDYLNGHQEEQARNNLVALSVFYGFVFIFMQSLSTVSIYIASNEPQQSPMMYSYLLLLGTVHLSVGYGLYVEAKKAKVPQFLRRSLFAFVSVVPVFYSGVLGNILPLDNSLRIIGIIIYGISVAIVGYYAGKSSGNY